MARPPARVVWLTPVPPDRAGGGGHIRQAHLLQALAERAEVELISSLPVRDPAVREAVAAVRELGVPEIDWSTRPRLTRRVHDLATAFGSTPREVAAFGPVRRAMAGLVAGLGPVRVVVEYAGLAALVSGRRPGQRWFLTLHNLASEMAAQEAAIARGRRQRWLYRRDAAVARRWEREIVDHYDSVIAVSADDARVLDPGGERVSVVPNGVEVGAAPPPLGEDPVVVFTGALYTGPNRDGINWFCREIWPAVRAAAPGATLLVVGARPGSEVTGLGALPGVEIHADVPDIRPYLARARVAIVPLRIGSGTRLKALEAMAAGRPLVGTSIGLAGLDLADGVHASFADDPDLFAQAVVRLLRDPHWAVQLATSGRRLVEERYDWRSIGARFAAQILDGW